jgi:hypothetical protein
MNYSKKRQNAVFQLHSNASPLPGTLGSEQLAYPHTHKPFQAPRFCARGI